LNRKIVLGVSLSILVFISVFLPVYFTVIKEKRDGSSSIIIWGDADLEAYGFPGKGILEDPYLIQDLKIETTQSRGISLYDITVHVRIVNCEISAEEIGIYAQNMGNGRLEVVNNVCNNMQIGIYLKNTDYVYFKDNTCNNNSENGVLIENSIQAFIHNNKCSNNKENGIKVINSDNSDISFNILNGNRNAGLFLYDNNELDIRNNTMSSNDYGIYCQGLEWSHIEFNQISLNRENGLLFDFEVVPIRNFFNYLAFNLFLNNSRHGVKSLVGGGHTFHHNSFVDNYIGGSSQAADSSNQYCIWYDIFTTEGNFWNDYTGPGNYSIAGTANAVDPYPLLINPWE
jgi:parallel beta-helix repeat protein